MSKARLFRVAIGPLAFCLIPLASPARAQSVQDDIDQLRATLKAEIAAVHKREDELALDVLQLDRKSRLLDDRLRALRGAGRGPGDAVAYPSGAGAGAETVAVAPSAPARSVRRKAASAKAPDQAFASSGGAASANPASTGDDAAGPATPAAPDTTSANAPVVSDQGTSISGPSAQEQQAKRVLETASTLSTSGGILTPKGQIVVDPWLEYDYYSQNQLGVNGFQIIPGITFGNIFVNRVEQNIGTAGVTVRVGVTNRLEFNAKIPYILDETNTNSVIPVGANAQLISQGASNEALGDLQFGASYQINAGEQDWPIFLANLMFKTNTGVSPFDVPVVQVTDPNGQFLQGTAKKAPTGTGFNSLEPSLTVIYPTAPGTLFANLLYIENFEEGVNIQSTNGGPSTRTRLKPGSGLALTFGIGFALNDRTSLSLSYQQEHVFSSQQNGHSIKGSAYSFGTFNFGVGYEISRSTRVNVNIGIGAGPDAPAARLLVEVPYRFSL